MYAAAIAARFSNFSSINLWILARITEMMEALAIFLKKEIIGAGCRNRIYVKMQFDTNKNLVSKEIENGEFIEEWSENLFILSDLIVYTGTLGNAGKSMPKGVVRQN